MAASSLGFDGKILYWWEWNSTSMRITIVFCHSLIIVSIAVSMHNIARLWVNQCVSLHVQVVAKPVSAESIDLQYRVTRRLNDTRQE
ncbi:hypothetical protein CY34DRAFT_813605 [Suillus luteus UH-Slu-Lm8-n1]|uniref:Uncharacterized protein n=1 Tax=Suillus luteus UH-Slu-Lm8-n1 TaxID=930992 RepID=A0A0D0A5G5_9AGAM|nr:hypothetical protein CY34DRAFT_813605 [Suillus luteus UH-Slu-Lm8-n1]